MKNKEMKIADFSVSIPTHKRYPAMNISHALTIILYELSLQRNGKTIASHVVPASSKDKQVFLKKVDTAIKKLPFATESKRETQRTVWKKLIGKSFLTERELYALHGFLRKIKK